MFRFFRPHRTPQERADKEQELLDAKQQHNAIVEEAVDAADTFQRAIRGGPRLELQLQRIKQAMRTRES